jgi:hypothetical protein
MASILLYRKGALITASLSSLMFAGQYILTQHGVLPSTVYTLIEPRTIKYLIPDERFCLLCSGLLSSYLSESLKRAGSELRRQTGRTGDPAGIQRKHHQQHAGVACLRQT